MFSRPNRSANLPDVSYDPVLDLIRARAAGYLPNASALSAADMLVSAKTFGEEDLSYFISVLESDLGLAIPDEEWRLVLTVDDLVQLLLRHLR